MLWRSNGPISAALAASADRFFERAGGGVRAWQLVDPEGRVIGGDAAAPPRSVARIIGNSEYPWTLHAWVDAGGHRQAPGTTARSCSR